MGNERGQVIGCGISANPRGIRVLEGILTESDFLLGAEFSVADVAVGSYLLYVPQFFRDVDMGRWPAISKYMLRLAKRPAFAKAYAQEHEFVISMCEKYVASDGGGGEPPKKLFGVF